MAIKKSLLVAGAVTTVGLGSLFGSAVVSAEAESDSFAGRIASHFKLDESKVKEFLKDDREARQAEHQKKVEERLSQAVEDGKLTTAQKDKILAKQKELKAEREANREAMKDKTREERREAMESKREELKKWAQENDIPEEYILFGRGHGRGPGAGGPPPEQQ